MIIFAIYEHPPEFPNFYVVRRWVVTAKAKAGLSTVPLAPFPGRSDPFLEPEWGGSYPLSKPSKTVLPAIEVEKACLMATSLKQARGLLPKGLKKMPQEDGQDPTIAELWV